MSKIYKINVVNKNNEIKNIFVFHGTAPYNKTDAKEILIPKFIHSDDTIGKIKEKILMECKIQTPIAGMYLFTINFEKLNKINIFNNLTQKELLDLTDYRLKSFLSNIVSQENIIKNKNLNSFFPEQTDKEIYEYEDFLNLKINWEKKMNISNSVGQKLVIKKNYPFIANPYNNSIVDNFLQSEGENIITTQNSYLLFKYFPIKDDNIYLCLIDDVLEYTKTNKMNDSYFLKLYFPILFKDVKNLKDYTEKKFEIWNNDKTKLKKFYKKINDRVDLFYNIYNNNENSLNYENYGISYVNITVRPENKIKLPLDILFKITHSTEKIPLIKYNPGYNYENIYRLYTDDNISVSGIKIPQLYIENSNRQTKINNISLELSKRKSVGYYIVHKFKNKNYKSYDIELYCEFNENGEINIRFTSVNLLKQKDIEKIIKSAINNEILSIIGEHLKQSGYKYIKFKNLKEKNVEINDLQYVFEIKNKSKINISKSISCVNSIFNIIKGKADKTTDIIELIYKRVNFFKEMDSIKYFITQKRKVRESVENIANLLIENFPENIPNFDKANKIISEWNQEIEMKMDANGSNRIIDSNPGFNTIIRSVVDSQKTLTRVIINNINDINYLDFVEIYIDSLLKIVLNKGFSRELKDIKDKLCSKKIKIVEAENIDIKAKTEKVSVVNFGKIEDDMFEISEEEEESDEESDEGEDGEEDENSQVFVPLDENDDGESKDNAKVLVEAPVEAPEEAPVEAPVESPIPTPEEEIDISEEEEEDSSEEDSSEDDIGIDTPEEEAIVIPKDKKEEEEDSSEDDIGIDTPEEEAIVIPKDNKKEEEEEEENSSEDDIDIGEPEDEAIGDMKIEEESDEEEESGEEEESDDEESDDDFDYTELSLGGGAKKDNSDDMDVDLSHLKISGSKSIFLNNLKEKDENLFKKYGSSDDKSSFYQFTKGCPGQYKKQPIVLTDEEKRKIDELDAKSNTKSYDESIRYGSPGNKKHNYICPRYWCIKDDENMDGKGRSLSLKQINDGECGGWDALIKNDNAKKIPKGKKKAIIEFTDKRFHREAAELDEDHSARNFIYRPMYPGFQKPSKHPENLCVPCCYNKPFTDVNNGNTIPYMFNATSWTEKGETVPRDFFPKIEETKEGEKKINLKILEDKKYDKYRRKKIDKQTLNCESQDDDFDSREVEKKTKSKKNTVTDKPTMEFPLAENYLGYIDIILQKFLGFNNKEICYTKPSDNTLKQQTYCFMRMGIELSYKQSFFSLLANVFDYYKLSQKFPMGTNAEKKLTNVGGLKKIFLSNLTIDKFIMAQNGILVDIFSSDKKFNNKKIKDTILKKIKDDKLSEKIVNSFENFKNYINDENEMIDYSYIWDFVCKPINKGGLLFENGINLIIFKHPNNDITDKIEIICPKNYTSNNFFDKDKKTLLVFHKNNYFEPLCKVFKKNESDGKKKMTFTITKFFSKKDFNSEMFNVNSNITKTIYDLKKYMVKCNLKNSIKDYDYEINISSNKLKEKLELLDITILHQIINHNGKVIGLGIKKGDDEIYIPSRSSGLNILLTFKFITDIEYVSYTKVKEVLKDIYIKSNREIPCDIYSKIISDNMVVGIKTITNQMIPVIPIAKTDVSDDIKEEVIFSGDSILSEKKILTSDSIDEERNMIIKGIELENNFYNLFRNTLRIIINYKIKTKDKMSLLSLLNNSFITYTEKMDKTLNILHKILDGVVDFNSEYKLDTVEDFDDMISCLGLKSNCEKTQHCFMRENTCKLSIPSTNLHNKKDNNILYFTKLADELIRYSKIRKYIFTEREFLTFKHINYRINDNEIVLLEEILKDKYFENIVLRKDDKYIKSTNIYEIKNPTGIDNNIYTQEDNCLNELSKITYTKKFIKDNFKNNIEKIKIRQYKNTPLCFFKVLELLIFDHTGVKQSINTIKNKLIDLYTKFKMLKWKNMEYEKGKKLNNISVFSFSCYFSKKKSIATKIIESLPESRSSKIAFEINQENYIATELDLFILLKAYNIPGIISMKSQKTLLDSNVKIFNTFTDEDNYVYVIFVKRPNSIKKLGFSIGLVEGDDYKINISDVHDNLKTGISNVDEYINNSLNYQRNKKKKSMESNRRHKKISRERIAKLGKLKIPVDE